MFASERVHVVGQIIGVVVAKTASAAREASRKVLVEYETETPVISIEDAIATESFFPKERLIERGNIDAGFEAADHVFSGEVRVGGQEHFYIEPQGSIVIPKREQGEFEIFSSTQNPTETQHVAAKVLGVSDNRVVCRVKRLGGGFGGKETRSVPTTLAAAVAAQKFGKPVRIILDRDEDMVTSGQRHPFLGQWRVGVSATGKILALDLRLYANGGWSHDLSFRCLSVP